MGYSKRPTGVTILAILSGLCVLLMLLLLIIGLFGLTMTTNPDFLKNLKDAGVPQWAIDNIGTVLGLMAIYALAFMVVYGLLAYGFWTGKKWSWKLGIAFAVVSIAWSIIQLFALPGLSDIASVVMGDLIDVIILVYLLQPGVKKYFYGRGQTLSPPPYGS